MGRRERLAAAAAVAWGLGCGAAPADPAGAAAPAASSALAPPASSAPAPPPGPPAFALSSLEESAPAAGPAPAWGEPVDVPLDAAGDGQPVALTLPAGRAALRLSPTPALDDDTRCYRLDQVTLGDLDWLPAAPGCLACGLALPSRPTEGFWALPGAETARTATVRFSLLDCLTGDRRSAAKLAQLGSPLRWQALAPPPLPALATLEVRIGLARGVAVLGGADGGRALWAETLAGVRAYFADAAVRVVVSRLAELPAPDEDTPVTSQDGDEQQLARWASVAAAALGPGAGQAYLPVVVVPCLVRDDLLSGKEFPVSGFTPRIPGGARADGRAEAVFVAGTCTPDDDPPAAPRLARVMAHELGHYLGLHHSDAPAGQPLSEPGKSDLMDSNIVYLQEALAWSPRQREALRLHPLLR